MAAMTTKVGNISHSHSETQFTNSTVLASCDIQAAQQFHTSAETCIHNNFALSFTWTIIYHYINYSFNEYSNDDSTNILLYTRQYYDAYDIELPLIIPGLVSNVAKPFLRAV